jgi:hypothetical protein
VLQTIGALGRMGFNQFEIVFAASHDWLIVGNWRFHYYQALPP